MLQTPRMLGKPCGKGLQRNSMNSVSAPLARLTMLSPTPVNRPLGPLCESHQLRVASTVPAGASLPRPTSLSVMLLSWICDAVGARLHGDAVAVVVGDVVLDDLRRAAAGHVGDHDAAVGGVVDRCSPPPSRRARESDTAAPLWPPTLRSLSTMLTSTAGVPSCCCSSMCPSLSVMVLPVIWAQSMRRCQPTPTALS